MAHPQSESTLADFLRVIRQQRVLITSCALLSASVVLGISLAQRPTYDASASVSVRDSSQDLALLGIASASNTTPEQQAAAHVGEVTRPEVVQAVRRSLGTSRSLDQLRGSVAVSVDPSSDLVIIDAHARHAAEAASIANAFALEDVSLTTMQARRSYTIAARQLARKIAVARDPTARAVYVDQLARLQSLSAVAHPVELSAMATQPGAPTSPRPVRNTLAAALFGLLLGITLAYAREALDHKLRHADEVEEQLDHPILGHVRNEALGHTSASANGSAALADTDEEGFRVLRQNVQYLQADEQLRSIAVTSAMPEEGKSTVAAGLAMANAAAGMQTLLIECDLRRSVVATRFGIRETPGLTDYLTGNAEPRDVLQHVRVSSPDGSNGQKGDPSDASSGPMIGCITAGTPPPRPAELLSSERFRTLLAEVVQVYDSVIIDCAPILSVADTLELIPHVAALLVCVRVGQTTRDEARAARAALARLPSRPTGVVLTGLSQAGAGYYGYY